MKRNLVVVLAVVLLGLTAVTCSALEYQVRDLGWIGPGYTDIRATGISDSGMILGLGYSQLDSRTHYAVWDQGGDMTELGGMGGHYTAFDINSSGTVVGYANAAGSTTPNAVAWDGTSSISRVLGQGQALSVNDTGQILFYNGNGFSVVSPDGTSHPVNAISGDRDTQPRFLNSNGSVAGETLDEGGYYHAAVWDTQGNGVQLPDPSGSEFIAVNGLNDSGSVVGRTFISSLGQTHAVKWDASGMPSLLPTLGGSVWTVAWDINNAGWAVGEASIGGPVIWDPSGSISSLPLLQGATSGVAMAINNQGWIVGYSTDTNGANRAVLWTPVPEPSSLLALAGGLLVPGLALLRRRRTTRHILSI